MSSPEHRARYEAACIAQDIPIVEISKKTLSQLKKWDAIIDGSKYRPKVRAARRAPVARKAPVRKAPAVRAPVVKAAPVLVWTVCKRCGLADAA